MTTYELLPRFLRDLKALSKKDAEVFRRSVVLFIDQRVRVKRVKSTADVWEMSWAPNGRATFQYGDEITPGEPHIIWRRVS